MRVAVDFTDDPATADDAAGVFLRGDALRHNVICTLLAARRGSDTPIRFWWATVDGEVRGAVFQSPASMPALLSRLDDAVVAPLARAVAEVEGPPIPGVNGPAHDAARFAGEYATVTRRPGHAAEGQRLYEIEHVAPPEGVRGRRRDATPDDTDLVARWIEDFEDDTGDRGDTDAGTRAAIFVASGRLHLWDVDGAPVASTFASPPAAGVVRVGFVYTPPPHRAHGYASALVADVSNQVLGDGHRCILYTQLANPTSNAIYQRLGYRPIAEIIRYAFD